jgi:pyruvate/2-oxoglutarate dehydrogenase complex dihydrolipoamide dehydrogenase (E3) component
MVSDLDDTGQVAWLDGKGIELLRGSARLADPGVVDVDGRRLGAEHIVIATGSEPVVPPVPGLAGLEGVWTNREATGLREIPRRLLVLGAGPVGVELAQAIARLGSAVAIVEGGAHLLPREPEPLGRGLARALESEGIEVHLGRHAVAAAREGGEFVLRFDGDEELRGDRLLVATGRRPRTAGLGLGTVGIPEGAHGIPVDARMAAGPGLWAVGDVAGIWPLTYVGKYQARIAAVNILGGDREASYDAVPRVVFTDPQVAAVGEPEGAVMATVPLSEVARTATYMRRYAERPGFLTLVSDGERLTGAQALGPEAGEWLQQATVAIRARVPLDVLADTIQPFPTFSEGFVAALAALRVRTPAAA